MAVRTSRLQCLQDPDAPTPRWKRIFNKVVGFLFWGGLATFLAIVCGGPLGVAMGVGLFFGVNGAAFTDQVIEDAKRGECKKESRGQSPGISAESAKSKGDIASDTIPLIPKKAHSEDRGQQVLSDLFRQPRPTEAERENVCQRYYHP
jgi:hypothetical protein